MRSEVSSARLDLAEAVGAVRASEGRLTGGFAHSRFASRRARVRNSRDLKKARERIEKARIRERSPQTLADTGVLNLLTGHEDNAVAWLEEATRRDPADAAIWSDLAVAYLARSEQGGGFTDLLKALEAADRAVETNPDLAEAQFNLAVVLDRMSLRWRARAAWQRFLDTDDGSAWSEEARERFVALFQPGFGNVWSRHRADFEEAAPGQIHASAAKLVQRFPQQSRELVEEHLLGRWALKRSQGRRMDADRLLVLAEAIGSALADTRDEHMIEDAVQVMARASAHEAEILEQLIEGHARYQQGLEQYLSGAYRSAAGHFSAAEKSLSGAGSPFELWARFWLAVCDGQVFRYDSSLKQLDALLGEQVERYPTLRARVLWVAGLYNGISGRPAESLAAYRQAWEVFDRLGEQENRALVSNLLAEAHRNLGDLPGAWRYHGLAIDGLRYVSKVGRKRPLLAELGVSLLADDRPRLSIYVQEELLKSQEDSLGPGAQVGGLRRMAEAQHRQGNPAKALSLIRQAERAAASVPEPQVMHALLGDIRALEGRIEAGASPRRAVRLLTEAISSCERTGYRQPLVRLLLERARALRRDHKYAQAESSLRQATELIRAYQPSDTLLAPTFDEVRQVYQEMVSLQVLQGQIESAFNLVEKGRAQMLSLVAPPGTPDIPVFTLEKIQRELPPEVSLIAWWIGEEELFSWSVRRDSLHFTSIPMNQGRLGRAAGQFRKAVAADDAPAAGLMSSWLYAALLVPIQAGFQDARRLVLVPDGALSSLPFGALQKSPGDSYLVEERILSVSPSASLYVHSLRRERELARIELSVVAFGNPSFDTALFPDLQPLPHAEDEARQIAGVYPRGRALLGPEATRSRMLDEMANWSVLHIGGHAVTNPANPFTTALALTPSGGDAGVLYLRELAGSRLQGTRLAVLAACGTLRGGPGTGAEIAAPMLLQGVPAVVGTLWAVDDLGTQALTADFHQRFLETRDAAVSLREAQLAVLRSSDSRSRSSLWASFELIGFR